MRFLDALELAQEIYRRCPSWTIYAIGRFKPIGDVTDSDPWKISVLTDGHGRPQIICSAGDFYRLLAVPAAPPPEPLVPSAPTGMLF